jgi:hypothetical protein
MTQPSTHLHPRAEVVGYSEPVLEAIAALVHEIDAHPELAAFSGPMMASIAASLEVADPRASTFMAAIAHLVTTAAEVALDEKGSDQ